MRPPTDEIARQRTVRAIERMSTQARLHAHPNAMSAHYLELAGGSRRAAYLNLHPGAAWWKAHARWMLRKSDAGVFAE